MAVFDLGPTGLTVAQPMEPGPAAEALARRGPGRSRCCTVRAISRRPRARWPSTGSPTWSRGVRNTGERALLVPPPHAAGAYIGFVGS